MARLLQFSSNWVDCNAGAIGHTGGLTLAALFTCTTTGSRTMLSINRPSLSSGYAELRYNGTTFNGTCNGGGSANPSSTLAITSGAWVLGAWTKPSGSAVLRFHVYDYATGTWARSNGFSARTDPDEAPSTLTLGGNAARSSSLAGNLAVAATWARNLSDTDIDRLPHSLAAWVASRPSALWVLDQAAATTPVRDMTGGGADQSASSGNTTVSTLSVPILGYGHPIVSVTREAGGAGATTITPDSITTAAAVGVPTLTPGAVSINPASIASTAALGQPTLTPAAVTVAPDPITSTAAVGAPTVTPGAVSVSPDSINPASTVGSPTLTPAPVTVGPDGIPTASTVGAPTLTPGGLTIALDSIPSTAAVGAPTFVPAAITIGPAGIPAVSAVGAPTLTDGSAPTRNLHITVGAPRAKWQTATPAAKWRTGRPDLT